MGIIQRYYNYLEGYNYQLSTSCRLAIFITSFITI